MRPAPRLLPLALLAAASWACQPGCTKEPPKGSGGPAVAAPLPPPPHEEIAEDLFRGGLKNEWQDWGWCPRATQGPGPASLHFAKWGGWMLTKQSLKPGSYGALVFRVKEPKGEAEFLEVRLEIPTMTTFPRVKLGAQHHVGGVGGVGGADGWYDVRIPLHELNPDDVPFDRVIFRAFRDIDDEVTLIDGVAFTKADPSAALSARVDPASYAAKAKPASVRIACDAKATKVSPLIYGIAYYPDTDKDAAQWNMGATARRFGGNSTTRYNWELGTWNLAGDWFFENKGAPKTYDKFLEDDQAHDMMSALTIPMLGWVAKDDTSFGFPVSASGPQEKTDPYLKDAGNGNGASGKPLPPGPPTRTSVPSPPEFMKRWVETIRASDQKAGKRSVHQYILDNEPALWSTKHRDVHPDALGYDELLDRTIRYGTAIRQADPDAVIAGPAEWGWTSYFYSAKDNLAGTTARPDRRAHDDVPLVEWYLRKLREHEQKTGVRILDVLDLHFYPQAENVYGPGGTDAKGAALRLRQTRGLWDPSYVDESWIKEPIRLLPRMKEWVDKNYPGRGLSIGEWNFGAEGHMSGALATAEALGRFAQFGVQSAFYWTHPTEGSPVVQGFLAYRNFDGKGGRFLDWYVPTTAADHVSLFASRDEAGLHLVVVAVNMSPDEASLAKVDMGTCGGVASQATYTFVRGARAFAAVPAPPRPSATLEQVLPPWSITVMDVRLARPMTGAVDR
jgi:Glycoside hydrolase family 44